MIRRRAKQIALGFVLLLFVAVQTPQGRHVEPLPPGRVPDPVSWDLLRAKVDEANWYAAVASTPVRVTLPRRQATPSRYGTGACGGDLPPCSVLACESGGNLTAQNPHSTASGKWQILDSTWGGYGGYSRAMYAPEDVQDERARQIYAGGAGRSAWVC